MSFPMNLLVYTVKRSREFCLLFLRRKHQHDTEENDTVSPKCIQTFTVRQCGRKTDVEEMQNE